MKFIYQCVCNLHIQGSSNQNGSFLRGFGSQHDDLKMMYIPKHYKICVTSIDEIRVFTGVDIFSFLNRRRQNDVSTIYKSKRKATRATR